LMCCEKNAIIGGNPTVNIFEEEDQKISNSN